MKYNELNQRASKLMAERHRIKFYEMVLCYGLENLYDDEDFEEITEDQFNELLSVIYDYLDDCYHVSVYDAVDGCISCIEEVGIEVFLEDCNSCGTMLEDKMCLLF